MERGPTVPIGTVLVGLNVLLREGLARILSAADFRILASASGVDDPVLSSLPQEQPILLIIDVSDDFDTALAQIVVFQATVSGRARRRVGSSASADRHGVGVSTGRQRLFGQGRDVRHIYQIPRIGHARCDTFASRNSDVSSLTSKTATEGAQPATTGTQLTTKMTLTTDTRMRRDNGGDDDGEMVGTEVGTNEHVPHAKTSYTPRLSARQQSILRCLIQGDSNKTIARKMAIAEATVKVHVKAILRRIRVHNRTQAAIWAMSNGPFISAKDDVSPTWSRCRLSSSPVWMSHKPVCRAQERISIVAELKRNGASHVALPSIVRLVKGIGRKSDCLLLPGLAGRELTCQQMLLRSPGNEQCGWRGSRPFTTSVAPRPRPPGHAGVIGKVIDGLVRPRLPADRIAGPARSLGAYGEKERRGEEACDAVPAWAPGLPC